MDAADLRRIGASYRLEPGQLRPAGERVWRLPAAGGDVAIKFYPAGQEAEARREARMLDFLGAAQDPGYRVQTLLRTGAGEPLLAGERGSYVLTRWEAGRFKPYQEISGAEWAALGRSLAALHLRLERMDTDGLATLGASLRGIDFARECERIATARAQLRRLPAGFEDAGGYLDQRLQLIERCGPNSIAGFPADEPQRAIHNDYNQYNYLFYGDLPPLILDWEAAIGAPREFEVVRCLNHLPLVAPALGRAFVEAYLQVRPLRAERLAWAVDTALLLHALKHWPLENCLHDAEHFSGHLRGSMELVWQLAGQRDRLLAFFHGCVG
jgi:Ser/Thr protein kinase RdoA (MazF antagonist)